MMNWISDIETKNGVKKVLNENLLAEHLKEKYNFHFVLNNFLDTYGDIENSRVEKILYDYISEHFTSPVTKITNVLKLLKIITHTNIENPNPNILPVKNMTYSLVDGELEENEENPFSLLRFNRNINFTDKKPIQWLKFLSELLHKDDIKILQEFMGYCLIPSTSAQEALVIIGKGGEGKSIIGRVIQALWGNKALFDKLQSLDTDKYIVAQLVNRLVFVDDDLETEKMKKTGVFKQLVTNTNKILIEDKYSSKTPVNIFARFIMFGNSTLQSLYDRSEGFFRRLKILRCKRIKPDRKINKLFYEEKIEPELDFIFNWCVRGLLRLAKQEFCFTESSESIQEKEYFKADSVNIMDYLESDWVEFSTKYSCSSARLYNSYRSWCAENATAPLALRSFISFLKDNENELSLKYSKNVKSENGVVRGFSGVKVKKT